MVDFTTTTDGGIGSPKFELRNLADDATLTTITIGITTPINGLSTRPNRPQSGWVEETYNSIMTPSGRKVVLTRGFRYRETLVFDIISVDDLAEIKAILSHPYKIKYYPHSDNTDRWVYINVVGDFGYLNQNITYPYHNATMTIEGIAVVESIPHYFVRQRILNHVDWTALNFTATEQGYALRAMNHADWTAGNFSAVEQTYGHVPQGAGQAEKDGYVSDGI